MAEAAPSKSWLLPLTLAVMTALTAGLLMFSQKVTEGPIAEQQKKQQLKALALLIPDGIHDNDLLKDAITLYEPNALGHRQPEQLFIGKQGDQVSVMAIPVTAQNGYSGDIKILVGIMANGDITAVEILQHKETPGLGDLIERSKSDWLHQFPGRSKQNPKQWKVKKDGGGFDQITGATITPRAVVTAIEKALAYHQNHRGQHE